jgi:hypothetical protein
MAKRLLACCLLTAGIFLSFSLFAQEDEVDVDGLMKNFFAATEAKKKSQAISLIRFAGVDPVDIEKRLRTGREYSKDAKTVWQVLYNKCSDGEERAYHLYVPEDYDPEKQYAVFYDLHGGVSTPRPYSVERMKPRRGLWGTLAKEKGFIVIIPHGERKALWWNKLGTDNVLEQLDHVKRNYNVDENKVFISGFSDGASGAYWMALQRPTRCAGFVPLSGNMLVARMGPYQAYPRNMLNRPIHATNGGRDSLYPSAAMKKLIDPIKKLGVDIDWTDYPEAQHRLTDYIETEMPRVMDFVKKTSRNPRPSTVVWETADTEVGRCDWVIIDKIEDVGNNADIKDFNLMTTPRLIVGIRIDQNFAGTGVRVQEVVKDSVAAKAGLKAGDVITKLDDTDVEGYNDLRKVLGAKKHGDKIKGEYKRGDQTHEFSGQFPEAKPKAVFPRKKTTGSIEVKVKGNRIDVRVKHVAKYTLLIDSKMFSLDEPVQVLTNGAETFNAKVKPDLVFMLKQAAQDNDRTAVYCAKIEIKVPAKEAKDESKEEDKEKEEPEEGK